MDVHCVVVMDATQMIIERRQKRKEKFQKAEADKEIERVADQDPDRLDPQENHLQKKWLMLKV